MNNNVKFDPMTGQPIQNDTAETPVLIEQQNTENNVQSQITSETTTENITTEISRINQDAQIQSQLQIIPTVEQNKQDFINNVQSANQEKKEEKKEKNNLAFIIILFILILAIIYLLFPILFKYI